MNQSDREDAKAKRGGMVKIKILVASLIEKSRFQQTHDITGRPMRSFCPLQFVGTMFQRCRF